MKRDVWQTAVYVLQLGLSIAAPPVCLSLLAFWLRRQFGLGLWTGVVALGIGGAISLATCVSLLRAFARMSRGRKEQ